MLSATCVTDNSVSIFATITVVPPSLCVWGLMIVLDSICSVSWMGFFWHYNGIYLSSSVITLIFTVGSLEYQH